jgi:hypothetical protein
MTLSFRVQYLHDIDFALKITCADAIAIYNSKNDIYRREGSSNHDE